MATIIALKRTKHSVDNNTILVSERDVKFDTTYEVVKENGDVDKFIFSHSTGAEFDPNTKYVYLSDKGGVLEVANDHEMVKKSAKAYLDGKLR